MNQIAIPSIQNEMERPGLRESQFLAIRLSREIGPLVPELRIEGAGDGLVCVTMPAPWAWLIIEQMKLQADIMRKELRLAYVRALNKRLETERSRQEIALRVKEREKALYEAYKALIRKGMDHKKAIHKARDTITPNWSVEIVERSIKKQITKAKREKRAREIYQAYISGVPVSGL